jgi:hypothetical protein
MGNVLPWQDNVNVVVWDKLDSNLRGSSRVCLIDDEQPTSKCRVGRKDKIGALTRTGVWIEDDDGLVDSKEVVLRTGD